MSNSENSLSNVESHIQESAQTIKEEAGALADTAKESTAAMAHEHADAARQEAGNQTNTLEDAVSDVAETLGEHNDTLGHYAEEVAHQLHKFSEGIQNRSVNELASDMRTLARDNPGMFMLGAITVGAVSARFFNASDTGNRSRSTGMPTKENYGNRAPEHFTTQPLTAQRSSTAIGSTDTTPSENRSMSGGLS